MVSVPLLPRRFCGACVQFLKLSIARIARIDNRIVYYCRLQTFSCQWALSFTPAVTEFLEYVLGRLVEYLFVVVQDDCFHIGGTAVA